MNCLEAGTGDLSLEAYLGGKRVPVRVDRMKKHVLKAEFTPQSPGTYRVKILYNGVEIKGEIMFCLLLLKIRENSNLITFQN